MVTLARTSPGLLYRSDGTLTGWTVGPNWTSVTGHRFVAAPTLPMHAGTFSPPMQAESSLYIYKGYWYLSVDNKLIAGKSLPGLQRSADRGITWVDLGPLVYTFSLSGISGLSAGLHLDAGDVWISEATTSTAANPGPTGGLNPPYSINILQSTTGIQGPYTLINTLSSASFPGTWAANGLGAGGAYYDGSNYNMFAGGQNVLNVGVIGLLQSPSWSGTFTITNPTTPVYDVTVDGPLLTALNMYGAEGANLTYNPKLGLFVMIIINIANAGGAIGGYDAGAVVQTSTNLTFSTSGWKYTQWACPCDVSKVIQQVGVACDTANVTAITGPNGEMLMISTGQDPNFNDAGSGIGGHYIAQIPYYAVLEPASAVLRYAGSSDTTLRRVWRPITHTDLTVELCAELTGVNGSGGFLEISYRGDSSGNNEYRAKLTANAGWSLVKVAGGISTTLVTGTSVQVFGNFGATQGMQHRLKVQVIGNIHMAILDGEVQYTYVDSSSPYTSGTACSVWVQGVNCDIINLSYRTSDTITVNGMTPNTSVWLRGFCGCPIAPVIANSSGVGTISYTHFPLYSLDIDGTDYTVGSDSRIWGGDTLTFSGLATTTPDLPTIFHFM